MADFCHLCSIYMFGEDYHDLADISTPQDTADGLFANVICESCGFIQVDHLGQCVTIDCLEHHNKEPKMSESVTIYPLRGMNFRPPAAEVVALLFYGAPLYVQREPNNEYDANAIAVYLPPEDGNESIAELLATTGIDANEPFMLGYIGKEFAAVIAPKMDEEEWDELPARLAYTADGTPGVEIAASPSHQFPLSDDLASALDMSEVVEEIEEVDDEIPDEWDEGDENPDEVDDLDTPAPEGVEEIDDTPPLSEEDMK